MTVLKPVSSTRHSYESGSNGGVLPNQLISCNKKRNHGLLIPSSGGGMKFTLQIKFEDDSTPPLTVHPIERTDSMSAANLGLTLDESKSLLANIQKKLVVCQFHHFLQNQRICSQCGRRRTIKDYHRACLKSLLGGVRSRIGQHPG